MATIVFINVITGKPLHSKAMKKLFIGGGETGLDALCAGHSLDMAHSILFSQSLKYFV